MLIKNLAVEFLELETRHTVNMDELCKLELDYIEFHKKAKALSPKDYKKLIREIGRMAKKQNVYLSVPSV